MAMPELMRGVRTAVYEEPPPIQIFHLCLPHDGRAGLIEVLHQSAGQHDWGHRHLPRADVPPQLGHEAQLSLHSCASQFTRNAQQQKLRID
jgi:hypothetical protein